MTNTISDLDERSLVGLVCLDPDAGAALAGILTPEDVADPVCAEICRRALSGPMEAVEAARIAGESMDADAAAAFIRECLDLAPTKAAGQGIARRVAEAAKIRRLRGSVHDAVVLEGDGAALADRLSTALQDYYGSLQIGLRPIGQPMLELLDSLGQERTGRVLTGYPSLDRLMGGMLPGQLILLGARPGVGKSAFAMNVALNAAEHTKVLLFSAEMTGTEVCQRLLMATAELPKGVFETDAKPDRRTDIRLRDAAQLLSEHYPIFLDDSASLTADRVAVGVRQHPDAGLVIVDYLGLMETEQRREPNRNLELGAVARRLKRLAGDAHVPILALTQLNRVAADTERPGLRSLRDSGELEQHADKVLLAWRNSGTIEVDVAKNRQGRRGSAWFEFVGEDMRFFETDEPEGGAA